MNQYHPKLLLLATAALLLVSCEKEEGPAEKMGKKIDEAASDIKEGYEEARQKAEEQSDEARERAKKELKELEEKSRTER